MRNHQQIVLAVVLDHTGALEQSFLILLALEDLHVGALDDIREVGLEFHQLSRTVDDIDAPRRLVLTIVFIEEQGAVVEVSHPRHNRPRSLSLLCREDVGVAHRPLLVGSQEGIEAPVMVFQ